MSRWLIPIAESYWFAKIQIFFLHLTIIDDAVVGSGSQKYL